MCGQVFLEIGQVMGKFFWLLAQKNPSNDAAKCLFGQVGQVLYTSDTP
jgi:hypothetical protein